MSRLAPLALAAVAALGLGACAPEPLGVHLPGEAVPSPSVADGAAGDSAAASPAPVPTPTTPAFPAWTRA